MIKGRGAWVSVFGVVLAGVALPLFASESGCSVADKPAKHFTPQDMARLRSVGSVAVSPDGKYVAYTVWVQRPVGQGEDGKSWTELHVLKSGRSQAFVTGRVNVSKPRWTADSRHIVYLAKRGEDKHKSLYVIPVDGGESRRLVAHDADISDYALSPPSDRVAFIALPKPDKKEEALKKKGFKAEIYEEDWRSPRVWLAPLAIDRDPFTPVDPADKAKSKPIALELPGAVSSVAWSPSADQLLVGLAPTPSIDDHYMKQRLRVVDLATGGVVGKIENPGKLGQVAYSPDGQQIAFISGEDKNDPFTGEADGCV